MGEGLGIGAENVLRAADGLRVSIRAGFSLLLMATPDSATRARREAPVCAYPSTSVSVKISKLRNSPFAPQKIVASRSGSRQINAP
jgi:hypothetical protein